MVQGDAIRNYACLMLSCAKDKRLLKLSRTYDKIKMEHRIEMIIGGNHES